MEVVTSSQITANAFRVLGLSADASQAEIDAAARRMRLWVSPGQIPATPWDMPRLGPVPRRRDEIERAVSQLHEPLMRIDQRLFWFAADPQAPGLSDRNHPTAAHDAALLQWQKSLLADPKMQAVDRWAQAMSDLIAAAKAEKYLQWFSEVESRGNFEKQTRPLEVQSRLLGMEDAFLGSVGEMARNALELDQFQDYDRAMAAMMRIAPSVEAAEIHYKTVADRIEDLTIARCNRMTTSLKRGINWDRIWTPHIRVNTRFCKDAALEVDSTISPLLARLLQVTHEPQLRQQRASLAVSEMLHHLGLAWGRTREYAQADAALSAALRWTPNARQISIINTNRQEIYQRLVVRRKTARGKSKGSRAAILAVVVGIWVLRALVNLGSSSQDSTPPVPSFNIPSQTTFTTPRSPTWPATPGVPSPPNPMPSPGMPDPAMPHPFMPSPPTPNPPMPRPYMPNPGMPNPGMPHPSMPSR